MNEEELEMLDEMQADYEEGKTERRSKRLENCGKVVIIYRNPMTGQPKINLYACNLPECERCSEKRGGNAQRQIEKAIHENNNVWMAETSSSDAQALIKKLGKDNYKCFPQDANSDRCIIFYSSEEELLPSKPVALEDVDDKEAFDWTEIARKRTGKRVSGALGKDTNPENQGTVKVKLPTLVAYTSDMNVVAACTRATDSETKDLDPHSEDELKEAVEARVTSDIEKLRSKGIECTMEYRTFRIDLSCIDWQRTIHDKFTPRYQNSSETIYKQASLAS